MNTVLSGHHAHVHLPGARRGDLHPGHGAFLLDAGRAALVNLVLVAGIGAFTGQGLQTVMHPLYAATLAAAACLVAAGTAHSRAPQMEHDYTLFGLTFILQVVLAIGWNLAVLWVLLHR